MLFGQRLNVIAFPKLGLAWDVFVQAASAKVLGLVSYHATVVPFSPDRMAALNNKITEAFKITAAASPHQMRCQQPRASNLSVSAYLT